MIAHWNIIKMIVNRATLMQLSRIVSNDFHMNLPKSEGIYIKWSPFQCLLRMYTQYSKKKIIIIEKIRSTSSGDGSILWYCSQDDPKFNDHSPLTLHPSHLLIYSKSSWTDVHSPISLPDFVETHLTGYVLIIYHWNNISMLVIHSVLPLLDCNSVHETEKSVQYDPKIRLRIWQSASIYP